jgi:hypothetical protein
MPPAPQSKMETVSEPNPMQNLFPLPHALGLSYLPFLFPLPRRPTSPYSGNAPNTENCPPAPAHTILRPRMAVLSTSVGISISCVVPCPVW